MLFRIYLISCTAIFVLTYVFLLVRIAMVSPELKRAMNKKDPLSPGFVLMCFIPLLNIFLLIGAIASFKQSDIDFLL